ncbi:MAG TPA: DUF1223 domain-containing protein [Rhizomicrobium sp.]|nr:DUF1223 domain-containing protein [Rhizomicrobium sp.]
MKRVTTAGSIIAAAVLMSATMSAPSQGADNGNLTVVELFQSQGCSSCPPANANVMALANRPDVLTLSFGVTYWDYLGWKDTFASPQYTARQWDYARAFHRDQVFTPEVVVNGRADVVGQSRSELEALIRRETGSMSGPNISIASDHVKIGASTIPATNADVWLIRYNPNIELVAIARGENGGQTLPHRNVVKELVKLGSWSGKTKIYAIPPTPRSGLRAAVLIQQGPGGAIVAAAHN